MGQTYKQGSIDVVVLDERVTSNDIDTARSALSATLSRRLPQLVVDLRRVRLIDSAGLELLCEVHETCAKRGGILRLAAPGPLVREILRVTGLESELCICHDVVAAAGAFAE